MSLEMNANLTKMYDFAKTAIGHEALSGEDSVIQTRRNAPGLVGRKWTKASATRASTRMPRRFHRNRPTTRIPVFHCQGNKAQLCMQKKSLIHTKGKIEPFFCHRTVPQLSPYCHLIVTCTPCDSQAPIG